MTLQEKLDQVASTLRRALGPDELRELDAAIDRLRMLQLLEHGLAVGDVMTATYFRANIPAAWRADYETQLRAAQEFAAARSKDVRAVVWRGLPPR